MTLKEFSTKGGNARMKLLSKAGRSALARKAALARWHKRKHYTNRGTK